MYGAVADLSGNIQHEIRIPLNYNDADQSLELLIDLIQELVDAPRPPGQGVRGIGKSLPGVTLSQERIVPWAPILGWRNLPIKKILSEHFGYTVIVENDVNLIALGELNFGAGKGVHNLVCITIGSGIGAGIIINRAPYLPKIEVSHLGSRAAVMGSIIMVLNATSEHSVVERLL